MVKRLTQLFAKQSCTGSSPVRASKVMANVERKSGIIDKGLEKWQKVNKITLAVGVSAGIVGIATGMPWLVTLGFGSAAVDGAQIVVLNEVKKRKNKPKEQVVYQSGAV